MKVKKKIIFIAFILSIFSLGSCAVNDGISLPSGKEITNEVIKTKGIEINIAGDEFFDNVGAISCCAEITPFNATDKDLIWTSSNESVAKFKYGNLLISKVNQITDIVIKATYKNDSTIFGTKKIQIKPFVVNKTPDDVLGKMAIKVKTFDGVSTSSLYGTVKDISFTYSYDSYSHYKGTTAIAKVKILDTDSVQYFDTYSQVNVKVFDNKTYETIAAFYQADSLIYKSKGDEYEMSFSFDTPLNDLGYSFEITANR